jgi:hypothetical protein
VAAVFLAVCEKYFLFLGMDMMLLLANFPPPHTSSGAYSSILGGSGNNDGGLNNVFIAGSGINAGAVGIPNALHVNGLWANGLPVNPATAPPGTVFISTTPVLPAWATGFLMIA